MNTMMSPEIFEKIYCPILTYLATIKILVVEIAENHSFSEAWNQQLIGIFLGFSLVCSSIVSESRN